jgi:tetratricopeptide (TPR) repeat protein
MATRRAFSLGLVVLCVWSMAAASAQADDPDELYRDRENMRSAEQAADQWSRRAVTDFAAAWKLARISYWLGTHGPTDRRPALLERGIAAGTSAIQLIPNRPEGHFWLAATMGALAEESMGAGLKYRGRIRSELERTIAIDPEYEGGSAEAALGQWFARVPRLFGGSKALAEAHFRRAITINSNSRLGLFHLAELLLADGRKDEARLILQRVMDAPLDPDWTPENKETMARAAALLAGVRP